MAFNKNPSKKKKEDNQRDKKQNEPPPIPPIVNKTEKGSTETQGKDNGNNSSEQGITVICPEKKESKLNVANIVAFAALIVAALSAYLANKSNEQVANQFRMENRPIIQLANLRIDSFGVNRRTIIGYHIMNAGRFPAIVESVRASSNLGINASVEDVEKNLSVGELTPVNVILSTANPIPQILNADSLPSDAIKQILNREKFFYVMIEVNYLDFATKDRYRYYSVMKIAWDRGYWDYIGMKVSDTTISKS